MRFVDMRFNSLSVWSAAKASEDLPPPDALAAPIGCLVWRQALTTVFCSTDIDASIAWRVFASGDDLSAMCEAMLDRSIPEEIPMRAATLLRRRLDDGLIVGLGVP